MADLTVGRAVVELLKAEGVQPHLRHRRLDVSRRPRRALRRPDVEYINVRHEQAAAFMADGLARVTDLPACAWSPVVPARPTCSPAWPPHTSRTRRSSSWSAAPRSTTISKDAFQEFDLVSHVQAGDQAGDPGDAGPSAFPSSCTRRCARP